MIKENKVKQTFLNTGITCNIVEGCPILVFWDNEFIVSLRDQLSQMLENGAHYLTIIESNGDSSRQKAAIDKMEQLLEEAAPKRLSKYTKTQNKTEAH